MVGVGVGVAVGTGVGVVSHESGVAVGEAKLSVLETTSMNAILVGPVAPVEIFSEELDRVPESLFEGVVQSRTLYL